MTNSNILVSKSNQEIDLLQTQKLIHEIVGEMDKFYALQQNIHYVKNEGSDAYKTLKNCKDKFKKIFVVVGVIMFFVSALVAELLSTTWIGEAIPKLLELIGLGDISILVYMFWPLLFSELTLLIVYLILKKRKEEAVNKGMLTGEEVQMCAQYKEDMVIVSKNIHSMQEILQHSILPKDYHNVYAVDYIVKAVENKRADTLKEAINLYEQHITMEGFKQNVQQSVYEAVSNIKIDVTVY